MARGARPAPVRRRQAPAWRSRWVYAVAGLGVVLVAVLVVVLARGGGSPGTAAGLPNTPDYHSLLVAPRDPRTLVLGTHDGLFQSSDGGRTWTRASLPGRDAMNLSRPGGGATVWAAGHDVLAKSVDGGATWSDVSPAGLPGLDVHGFAVDPRSPLVVYAAIAGRGLYRSRDGGVSFGEVSATIGPAVMALAVLPNGTLLAGDMQQQGLLASRDGGRTWRGVARASIMGLAVDPAGGRRVLASGPGVLLSTDGGASWRQALALDAGTGPIAWAPSSPRVAYVVGLDRSLYRSDDAGATWARVV